ncbi:MULTISPECIES: histidine phosphatase family protein [Rhodomicrobium]|uniref:histidine phosphatase family protein n=1 Tax=Rhodomicrobium TaxID=1068 RepID=UPI000B4B59DD|nr:MULTISPECIES: histidine phosphatase family protein [Rhodomicrobium]
MALIYFLRHGQTDWNAARRIQGHLDTPLNDTGRSQAARNGRALAAAIGDPSAFDFVSSPLVRASETMEIVRREMGLDPKAYRTDLRLREFNLGDWQGELYDELNLKFPDLVAERERDPWNFRYPGAASESYAMLSVRVLEWLSELERDTVVTAHGGVGRCIRRHFLKLEGTAGYRLDAPQDKVLRIEDGALSWI